MNAYRKALAAAAAALGVAVSLSADGHLSLNDLLAIAAAAVGALTVYRVPNTTGADSGTQTGA
jgi:hypothetical protein